MAIIALLIIAVYMTIGVKFHNERFFRYAIKLRVPKMTAMLVTSYAIGTASFVFQSIINNTIVTPCLLGLNSLYTVIHTAVVFFAGSGSMLALNSNMSFAVDLVIMGIVSMAVYSYLLEKTKHNILYVLLIGTVMSSFFASIQSTLVRIMDPNEYDILLTSLVASFSNINSGIIAFSIILLAVIAIVLRKEIRLLNVLTLGREQAVSLGIDYNKSVRKLLLGVTLYIAVATAMVGPVSFLGLIIANLSRQMFKTFRHSWLMAGSVLFGIIILTGGQLITERVFTYSIPVSVFITVGGGLYFLYLLLGKRRI
ncbi:MAG: iron chelate uptake ABC transporter family permease subunit [Eubacteriales bacterium]|nr:iron chelate uptake ABC transporter family permease subunit [Eubacteriales bacterium]